MYRPLLFAAVFALAGVGASIASAEPKVDKVPAAAQELVAKALAAKTGLVATTVEPAPVKGWFAVLANGKLYYVDSTGNWLFDGHLVDMNTKTSVSAKREAELNSADSPKLDFARLKLSDAFEFKRGKGGGAKRILVTFEDPNCGFCKRMFADSQVLKDVTIYTFPVSILGPASAAKNKAIWCSPDRASAWAGHMLGRGEPEATGQSCDTSALDRNMALQAQLKIRGTPAVFFVDGTRTAGAMTAEAIEKALAEQSGR